MKRILITGGAGFIGSKVALRLLELGFHVTVLDNLSPQVHGNDPLRTSSTYKLLADAGLDFVYGSVLDRVSWIEALRGQDAVIHLAAETGTGQSMYAIQKYVDVNVNGTAIFLDVLANEVHNIKKIVVASSRAVYGEGKYECPVHGSVYPNARKTEDMQIGDFNCKCPICGGVVSMSATDEGSKKHPTSIYGITKQAQEDMVMTTGKSLTIPSVAFRYQNVFGPGQSLANPYTGILSIFSTQIKNNNNLNIFEDGKESRDFVFIDDVVDATVLGLLKDEANYEVFNVGADTPIDVLTVAKSLRKNYGSSIQINISGNYRVGDIRHCYADISKINKLLQYSPKYSFEEGLRLFCEWVERQDIENDTYETSIEEMRLKGLYK